MAKNVISMVLAIFFVVVLSSSTYASPPPSQPECRITAKIIDNDAVHDPYTKLAKKQGVGEQSSGYTTIEIMEVEKEPMANSSYSGENYCIEQYEKGMEITLILDERYTEQTIIQGAITTRADEWMNWYLIDEIKILEGDVVDDESKQKPISFPVTAIFVTVILLSIILVLYLTKRRHT